MPESEQVRKNWMMQRRLESYDVVHWAGNFFKGLAAAKQRQEEMSARMLSPIYRTELISRFKNAPHRLLFLDYDGTLVPYSSTPADAKPPIDVLTLLNRLAEDPKTDLILISGRDRKTLDEWFSQIPAGLVAEHGAWMREKDQEWRNIIPTHSTKWMKEIRQILQVLRRARPRYQALSIKLQAVLAEAEPPPLTHPGIEDKAVHSHIHTPLRRAQKRVEHLGA
jgi:trehalose 6-phosphate synthase/phosphatase